MSLNNTILSVTHRTKMSLNNTILSVTHRTKKGFTVGEIFDRVGTRLANLGFLTPKYSTVRARVYELAESRNLRTSGFRRDSTTNRRARVFLAK